MAASRRTRRSEVLAKHDGVGQSFEVGIGGDELRTMAPGGCVHEGVRHREAVCQRDIGRFQGERLVRRRDDGSPHRRDRREGSLLREVASDDFVHFVDFDGGHEQRFAAFQIRREPSSERPIGKVLDPATRIDEDQSRSFFSRNARGVVPDAIPR